MAVTAKPTEYSVQISIPPCPHCGEGGHWDVKRPDDVAMSTSFARKEDAEELVRHLNGAVELERAKQALQQTPWTADDIAAIYNSAYEPNTKRIDFTGKSGFRAVAERLNAMFGSKYQEEQEVSP